MILASQGKRTTPDRPARLDNMQKVGNNMQKIILEITDECAQHVRDAAEKSGTTPERYIAGCIWRTVPKTIPNQETKQAAEWALFDLKNYYV